jgi:hypothetical protein
VLAQPLLQQLALVWQPELQQLALALLEPLAHIQL